MVKRLEFSLKATTSASQIKFFSCWSNLIQSRLHVMENALFLRFFRSLLITYLITLSLEKGKRLEFSLKATTSASQIKFFSCWSNLIQSRLHVMENALFLRFFRSLLITYLITLSLEKGIIILEKV